MEQRTCNIIMLCKWRGRTKYSKGNISVFNSIAKYMGDECEFPWELYDYRLMEEIMLEALYDFIDEADRPSLELRRVFDTGTFAGRTLLDRIFSMFSLTKVKNENRYLNGFTEEMIKESEETLGIGEEYGY